MKYLFERSFSLRGKLIGAGMFLIIVTLFIAGIYLIFRNTHQENLQDVYYDSPIKKIRVLNGHTGERFIVDKERDILLISDKIASVPLIEVDEEIITVDGFAYLITIEGEVNMNFSSYDKVKMGDQSYMFKDKEEYNHLIDSIINLIQ